MIPGKRRASTSRNPRKSPATDGESAIAARTPAHEEEVVRLASEIVAARHAAQHADIAREAYYRAERRGFAPGHELDDWLAAEGMLNGNTASAAVDDPADRDGSHDHLANEV